MCTWDDGEEVVPAAAHAARMPFNQLPQADRHLLLHLNATGQCLMTLSAWCHISCCMPAQRVTAQDACVGRTHEWGRVLKRTAQGVLTVQGVLTWPLMLNSLVPWLFLRPKEENHSGPRRRIVGATATLHMHAHSLIRMRAFTATLSHHRRLCGDAGLATMFMMSSQSQVLTSPRW